MQFVHIARTVILIAPLSSVFIIRDQVHILIMGVLQGFILVVGRAHSERQNQNKAAK